MATEEKTVVLSGLARTLVRGGHIEQEKAEELFKKSQKKKTPFVNLVIGENLVPSSTIASASAKEFGIVLLCASETGKISKIITNVKLINLL